MRRGAPSGAGWGTGWVFSLTRATSSTPGLALAQDIASPLKTDAPKLPFLRDTLSPSSAGRLAGGEPESTRAACGFQREDAPSRLQLAAPRGPGE